MAEREFKAKVSNGEYRYRDGKVSKYTGPGTITSDSITANVRDNDAIVQPNLFPSVSLDGYALRKNIKDAGDILSEVDSKWKTNSDAVETARGVGSITAATNKLNEVNRLAEAPNARKLFSWAVDNLKYFRGKPSDDVLLAKRGKDIPGFSGGDDPARAWLKRQEGNISEFGRELLPPLLVAPVMTQSRLNYINSLLPNPANLGPLLRALSQSTTQSKTSDESSNSTNGSDLGNIIVSGLGALTGLGQYLSARGQSLARPRIYAPNLYAQQALTTMAKRRANVYPQLQAMRDAEARNRYAIRNSGGLTGAQKYLAAVASGIGLQRNYADIIAKSQELNNQYASDWANLAYGVGAQDAQLRQHSNQYLEEAYAKASNAREQQKQTGMYNILNYLSRYYANQFKNKTWLDTMGRYDDRYGSV